MSETLSQNEIDELLQKALAGDLESSPEAGRTQTMTELSPIEMDALGEISNISMGAAATALHAILGRKVVITTPDVAIIAMENVSGHHQVPFVMVDVEYASGFAGHNLFILQIDDVKIMTDVMMGGPGVIRDEELSELHLSAISEAMNQMMGGMATAMADMFNHPVNISPPRTQIVTLTQEHLTGLVEDQQSELIRAQFKLEIEGLLNSSIMQLMPVHFGRQLVERVLGPIQTAAPVASPARPAAAPLPVMAQSPAPVARSAPPAMPDRAGKPAHEQVRTIEAKPIELVSFDVQDHVTSQLPESGMDLILDVPLQITVELGQCKKPIKEILELNIGSIVALDRLAGEPVDVVVNGKSVAKGEVIVIDDNYGVRITEVFSGARKMRSNV
ncbi:MAG: flagellar motor switch phosphatase FliY [Eubacteriales bacterium]|nr:flagellar motor switch phosphatase FliY [Eubacteriales bacterium]